MLIKRYRSKYYYLKDRTLLILVFKKIVYSQIVNFITLRKVIFNKKYNFLIQFFHHLDRIIKSLKSIIIASAKRVYLGII